MKQNDYQKAQENIMVVMNEAKVRQKIKDKEMCSQINTAVSTIRDMRCQQRLPCLPFWKVMAIAQMAGYEVRFERKGVG